MLMHCLQSDFIVSSRHGIFLALSGIARMVRLQV